MLQKSESKIFLNLQQASHGFDKIHLTRGLRSGAPARSQVGAGEDRRFSAPDVVRSGLSAGMGSRKGTVSRRCACLQCRPVSLCGRSWLARRLHLDQGGFMIPAAPVGCVGKAAGSNVGGKVCSVMTQTGCRSNSFRKLVDLGCFAVWCRYHDRRPLVQSFKLCCTCPLL